MAIGEYIQESKGKVTPLRVLENGKMEASFQATGKLLGVEVSEFYTGVTTPQPGGALYMEGDGIITSTAGDSEVLKFRGMGRSTGAGFKASYRGSTFCQTASSRFAKLLNIMTVWEVDVDEAGNFLLKIWEWK
ncbi:MAG TPA: hypothetical protein VGQ03_09570 [Nitrososphaera sp.]|jgi:hypothetical protein|nr:hypothetical protein [Nitrososphaera sp.]